MEGVKGIEIITVLAIITGPLLAILSARYLEERKKKFERRMDVFRNLMRTRKVRHLPDHVYALNLVEIEFYGNDIIIEKLRKYFQHLSIDLENSWTNERKKSFFDERDRLLTELLYAIGTTLGYKIEQLEIYHGGYSPQIWWSIEEQQVILRDRLIDLLNGKSALFVADATNRLNPTSSPTNESAPEKENRDA